MFNSQFKKSIIEIHDYYDKNNYKNSDFLGMIDNCFDIKKTTFYNWYNDEEIINCKNVNDNIVIKQDFRKKYLIKSK